MVVWCTKWTSLQQTSLPCAVLQISIAVAVKCDQFNTRRHVSPMCLNSVTLITAFASLLVVDALQHLANDLGSFPVGLEESLALLTLLLDGVILVEELLKESLLVELAH